MQEEHKQIAKSSLKMSVMTTISRALGLIRDQFQAALLGTSFLADAFSIGFMLPNLLRRLFAEGNMSVSFIPIFTEVEKDRSQKEARDFFISTFTLLMLILFAVIIVGIIISPLLVRILYASASADKEALTLATNLSRIMFPYLLFISLSAIVTGVLNIHGKYALTAASPVFLNITIISVAFLFYFVFPNAVDNAAYIFAFGVILGGIIQFSYQLPALHKTGYCIGLRFNFHDEAIKRIIKLFVPGIFGASIYQINLLVSTAFAGAIGEGRVSAVTYATRLNELTLGIFAVSIATVMLPTLSKAISENRIEDAKKSMNYSIRLVALTTIPAMAGLVLLSKEIVYMLFGFGRFSENSVMLVSTALRYLSLSLFFVASYRILVQAFYAMKDTKTPVYIALATFIVNAATAAICVYTLHFDIKGIAIAGALANTFSFFILYTLLSKKMKLKNRFREFIMVIPTIISTALMSLFVVFAKSFLLPIGISRVMFTVNVIIIITLSVLLYMILNIILKNKDFTSMLSMVFDKIKM